MTETGDHTIAWMRRLDAKLDRVLSVLEDHTGRLQRVEGRLTSLAARFAVIETFDSDVARIDQQLDEQRTAAGQGRGHDGAGRATGVSGGPALSRPRPDVDPPSRAHTPILAFRF